MHAEWNNLTQSKRRRFNFIAHKQLEMLECVLSIHKLIKEEQVIFLAESQINL